MLVELEIDIPLFEGEEVTAKVIGIDPPVTVFVSYESDPAETDKLDDDPPPMTIAAVATILTPSEAVAYLLSVTVMVSKYVPAGREEVAFKSIKFELAVLVSIDIALFDEVVRVKVLFPVPPVTVIVSDNALPTVAGTVYPRAFVSDTAELTITVNTADVVDPTLSVAVMVSV